jgi:hypothetical protein
MRAVVTCSKILAVAVVVLLVGMLSCVFGFALAGWRYRAEISIEDGGNEYCRLVLAPEIYNVARHDLCDIRILDTNGEQVPYVLAKPQDITERQKYKPAVINRSINENNATMVTLDFGKRALKNSIEVSTRGDSFRRIVKVEGSSDNIEFFTLVEQAYVFAVSHSKRFEQVDLPTNDYRYLRISVWPMVAEAKSPIIEEVRAFKIESKFAKRQPTEMILVEHIEDERNNLSIYVYDLAYSHLPISEIELDVVDDSFYRYVTVEGRDKAKQRIKIDSEDSRQRFREIEVAWERIISGAVYRYTRANGQKSENLILRVPSNRNFYRYLKITVKNYDDKPVIVKSVTAKMIAHQVVFEAEDNATYALYVGSESAKFPRYDIEKRLNNPLQVKAKIAQLGDITDNPIFKQAGEKPVAWTERHKVFLPAVLVLMVLVLAVFILKSFKSIKREEVQN